MPKSNKGVQELHQVTIWRLGILRRTGLGERGDRTAASCMSYDDHYGVLAGHFLCIGRRIYVGDDDVVIEFHDVVWGDDQVMV